MVYLTPSIPNIRKTTHRPSRGGKYLMGLLMLRDEKYQVVLKRYIHNGKVTIIPQIKNPSFMRANETLNFWLYPESTCQLRTETPAKV